MNVNINLSKQGNAEFGTLNAEGKFLTNLITPPRETEHKICIKFANDLYFEHHIHRHTEICLIGTAGR